jgi:phage repressor protein C with HTH and peptisase S24 domain
MTELKNEILEKRKERLNEAILYLISTKVISVRSKYSDVADKMAADKTTVSNAVKGHYKYLTDNFFKRFNQAFNDVFNNDWLLTGKDEMLKINDNSDGPSATEDADFIRVPVYNFDAVGGMHTANEITDDPAYIERYIPFPGARHEDICVPVTGNSMIPTYSPGSLLLLRKVEGWREYFGYGHCFVILLKDGRRILKEVQKSEVDPEKYVLCVSYGPKHPSEELPRDFISLVYKVIMSYTNEGF